jgi:hypothetical protein
MKRGTSLVLQVGMGMEIWIVGSRAPTDGRICSRNPCRQRNSVKYAKRTWARNPKLEIRKSKGWAKLQIVHTQPGPGRRGMEIRAEGGDRGGRPCAPAAPPPPPFGGTSHGEGTNTLLLRLNRGTQHALPHRSDLDVSSLLFRASGSCSRKRRRRLAFFPSFLPTKRGTLNTSEVASGRCQFTLLYEC